MASYDIRTLQTHIQKILSDVDLACKQHNLRYYIIAGTLLGAIRHKGFIPWDDDIDIAMPRPDYDRLMAHAKEILPPYLEVISQETDSNYPLPFAKIQDARTTLIERLHLRYLGGIYIDVFPLDGMSNSALKRRLHFMHYEYWKKVLYFIYRDPYKHGHGPSCWLPLLCRKLYTLQSVQHKLHRLQTAYSFDQSKLIVDHDDGIHGVMKRYIFGKPTPYNFENQVFMGPEKAHQYLQFKYGDYKKIPKDSDKRQHNFDYLNLNQPYRGYQSQEAQK